MTGSFCSARPDHGSVCWNCPATVWREQVWAVGRDGALYLGMAAVTAFPHARHVGALAGLLAFGAAVASWACAGGRLVPGGLLLDTWSQHFQ